MEVVVGEGASGRWVNDTVQLAEIHSVLSRPKGAIVRLFWVLVVSALSRTHAS